MQKLNERLHFGLQRIRLLNDDTNATNDFVNRVRSDLVERYQLRIN